MIRLGKYSRLLLFTLAFFTFFLSEEDCVAQKKKQRINILNAESLEYDDALGKDVQRLVGDVKFENRGNILDCDSAYFYPDNTIEAFGRVHINQGDSIHLYSDSLEYDGNDQFAESHGHVRLEDRKMVLTTTELYFNLKTNVASYPNHAHIVNNDNTLESIKGSYDSRSENFSFKDSVILINPEYKMLTDTLRFNMQSEIAYFLGPTWLYSDETTIYTEKGWYDTKNDNSELSLNNILSSEGQEVRADSILYDRASGKGRAFNNVLISDTTNDVSVGGEYGLYNQKSNRSYVTEKATMIQAFEEDSLFLHADTLWIYRDTINDLNEIYAYYGARFFKPDMQGVCDSLVYVQKDSLIRMYTEPVLWSEENQISGEYMEIEIYGGELQKLHIIKDAFIISEVDSIHYNQIKGRNMVATFKDNEMDKIYVNGNGQTIYFAQDEEKEGKPLIGVNNLDCSNIIVHVVESKIKTMTFLKQPNGMLIPMDKADESKMRLNGFQIQDDVKPISKEDIYRTVIP